MLDHSRRAAVLITRPLAQGRELSAQLLALGYDTILCPMLNIETLDYDCPDLALFKGLIFTSVNAVCTPEVIGADAYMPIYCVGEKTAESLENLGWKVIKEISGNIDMLERALRKRQIAGDMTEGRYLHLCGADIVRPLAVKGVHVTRIIAYKAHKTPVLDDGTVSRMRAGDIDVVLFYSPRTAEAFVQAVEGAGCTSSLNTIKALCLSDLVLNSLQDLPWQSVQAVHYPDGRSMVERLLEIAPVGDSCKTSV